jgi:hypothetical protein
MTFKDYFAKRQIGPRHLKNDGLLNTRVPHNPVPDMHKIKKADGTEELKNNGTRNFSLLNNLEKIKELKKKHPYVNGLKPGESKTLVGTNISISLNPKGGYILQKND